MNVLTYFLLLFFIASCNQRSHYDLPTDLITETETADHSATTPLGTSVNVDVFTKEQLEFIDKSSLEIITSNISEKLGKYNSSYGTCKFVPEKDYSIEFIPVKNFSGETFCYYKLCTIYGDCGKRSVKINVKPGEFPKLVEDIKESNLNEESEVDVVENDFDPDDNLDLSSIKLLKNTSQEKGVCTLRGTKIKFLPKRHFSGKKSCVYKICDQNFPNPQCSESRVVFTIKSGKKPRLVKKNVEVIPNKIAVIDVLAEAIDDNIDIKSLKIISQPRKNNGVCFVKNDKIYFERKGAFVGRVACSYEICDLNIPTPQCSAENIEFNILPPLTEPVLISPTKKSFINQQTILKGHCLNKATVVVSSDFFEKSPLKLSCKNNKFSIMPDWKKVEENTLVSVSLYQFDEKENASSLISEDFILDVLRPSPPVVLNPKNNSYYQSKELLSGTCEEDSKVTIENENLSTNPLVIQCEKGKFQSLLVWKKDTIESVEKLFIKQTDPSGNTSDASALSLVVDRVVPKVNIFSNSDVFEWESAFFEIQVLDYTKIRPFEVKSNQGKINIVNGGKEGLCVQERCLIEVTELLPGELILEIPANSISDQAGNKKGLSTTSQMTVKKNPEALVTDVFMSSLDSDNDGWYEEGDELEITLVYSQKIDLTEKDKSLLPSIDVELIHGIKKAIYKSGAGSNKLVFTMPIDKNDENKNGQLKLSHLSLNTKNIFGENKSKVSNLLPLPSVLESKIDAVYPNSSELSLTDQKDLLMGTCEKNSKIIVSNKNLVRDREMIFCENNQFKLSLAWPEDIGYSKETLSVQIFDLAGNSSLQSSLSLVVDKSSPQVLLKSKDEIFENESIIFSLEVLEEETISPFELILSQGDLRVISGGKDGFCFDKKCTVEVFNLKQGDLTVEVPSGAIKDPSGNVNETEVSKKIVIKKVPDTIIEKVYVSSKDLDNDQWYEIGDELSLTISYDKPVSLKIPQPSETPFLLLRFNNKVKKAVYQGGNKTKHLVFTTLIEEGDELCTGQLEVLSLSYQNSVIKGEDNGDVSSVLPEDFLFNVFVDTTSPSPVDFIDIQGFGFNNQSPETRWSGGADNCEVSGYSFSISTQPGESDIQSPVFIGDKNSYMAYSGRDNMKFTALAGYTYHNDIRVADKAGNLSKPISSQPWSFNCQSPWSDFDQILSLDSSNLSSLIDSEGFSPESPKFNGRVSSWLDQSGNHFDLSMPNSSSQPVYVADSNNNQMAAKDSFVQGDGVDDWLNLDIPTLSSSFSFIYVLQAQDDSPSEYESFFSNSDDPQRNGAFQIDFGGSRLGYSGKFRVLINDQGKQRALCGAPYDKEKHVVLVKYDFETNYISLSMDGKDYDGTTLNQDPIFRQLNLFVNRNRGSHQNAKAFEVSIVDQKISQEEQKYISDYLICKWGVSL